MVPKVCAGRDEYIETRFDRGSDELGVLQARPATAVGRHDRVPDLNPSEWCRRSLVKEDLHLRFCKGAAGHMIELASGLFWGDALEPIEELVERRIVFEVLKESRHQHTTAAKHPGAARQSREAHDGRAREPINRLMMVAPRIGRDGSSERHRCARWATLLVVIDRSDRGRGPHSHRLDAQGRPT